MRLCRRVATCLGGVLAIACTEVETARVPPTADAGVGQVVRVGERATLDGSGSHLADGSSAEGYLSWSIALLPPGSTAELSNASGVNPSFDVDAVGDFVFRLVVVVDNGLSSAPSFVVVRGYQPLEVTYQTPPDGSFEAPRMAPVVLAFSEPLQPETVTPETVYLRHGATVVSGFVEVFAGNTLVVLTPGAEYPAGAVMTAVVTQNVVAISGASLQASYSGRFQVATEADARGPAVVRISPADQTDGVAATTSVTAVFDEPIDLTTVTVDADADDCPDNFTLVNVASTECVPASVVATAANTHVLWTPLATLSPGGTFDVIIRGGSTGVRDGSGNPLAADFGSQLTVSSQPDPSPLAVQSVYPGPFVTGVPLGASIVITFNKPFLATSINDQSVAVVRGTTPAVGTIELSMGNTVVTLTPDTLLQPNTDYNVVVRGTGAVAVLDYGGAQLDGDGDGAAGGDFLSRFVTTATPSFDGELTLPLAVVPGATISVSLSDRDLDTSVESQMVDVVAVSSTGETETITLTETGARTGVFEGSVATVFAVGPGTNGDGSFYVQVGDLITFTYLDEMSAAGSQRFEVEAVLVAASVAGIIVSAISGDTTEGGGTATFAVNLASEPTADVTLTFDSDDPTEGTVNPTTMTFTPGNFASPQLATVTGQDDGLVDGHIVYHIVFDPAVSSDGAYDGLTPAAIELQNLDNDTSGIDVSAISGPTGEWGGTATFTVVLESQPSADVVLTFDSDNLAEGTVSPTTLTFTTANWDQAQTVTVTGVNDDIDDGNAGYSIVFDPTASADSSFDGISLPPVAVTNLDDDTAGFVFNPPQPPQVPMPTTLTTTENGGTHVFTVRLETEPVADVTLNFASSDSSEGTLSTNTLTFTAANWNLPQPVTVTGEDDTLQDGDQSYLVDFSASTTTDPVYLVIQPFDVPVTNLEVGSDPTAAIVQGDVEPGAGILVRVRGEVDEYANLTAGAGNDTLEVTVTSDADSETFDLWENTTAEGDFDCIEGCFLATAPDSGSATADDGTLEIAGGHTVTVEYTDMMRSDGTATGIIVSDSATVTDTGTCVDLFINELVTTAQQDWNDTSGGNGIEFDGIVGDGTVDYTDQWVELYNGCPGAVNLEAGDGYKLNFDTSAIYDFNNRPAWSTIVGTPTDFPDLGYLVVGQPANSAIADNVWVRLELPDNRGVLDQVALGTSPGGDGDPGNNTVPSGSGSGPSDEAVRRASDGGAWDTSRGTATIGGTNN